MEEIKERRGEERPPDEIPPEEGGPKERLGEDGPPAEGPQKRGFLVDLMLLRLGRWLRLLGQDVANPENESDKALLAQAKRENRVLITRDKRLFSSCSAAGVEGILIRSSRIEDQLLEMARGGVPMQLDPQRCTLCNGPLQEVEISGEVAASVRPLAMRLWRCDQCQKLYWEGGHWKRMEIMIKDIVCRKDSTH